MRMQEHVSKNKSPKGTAKSFYKAMRQWSKEREGLGIGIYPRKRERKESK